jgi:CHAT domain-containing protein
VRLQKCIRRAVIGVLFLTSVVRFDQPLVVTALAQTNEADPIRLLVEGLFEAYQHKDIDKIISNWSEKSPFLAESKKKLQGEFSAYEKIVVKSFDIRQSKIDYDKASLRVVAEMALVRAKTVKPVEKIEEKNRTIDLVNEGGSWKIWKFIASEEELAAAILAAKTEEERKNLMEKEPKLITCDLVDVLIHNNNDVLTASRRGYQYALEINRLASKLAEQLSDQLVIANVAFNAGIIYGWIGTPEKSPELALECFQKSLKIGEEFGFKSVAARSLISSALMYSYMGELSPAEEYYQKSLKLAEELGSTDWTTQVLNNLGIVYRLKGNISKALELQSKTLKLSESRLSTGKDWYILSLALQNISETFESQGNHEQALVYGQNALNAADKGILLGEPLAKTAKAHALASIGTAYLEQGNNSLAMNYFQIGLKLVQELGNTLLANQDILTSAFKSRIARLLAEENKTLEAIASYQEVRIIQEKSGIKLYRSKTLQHLSDLYLLQGDYREALTFAEQAVKAAEIASEYYQFSSALVTAARAYRKLGQTEEAYQALTRAIDNIEQLRGQVAGGELERERSFEEAVTPYQAMIDLQVDRNHFMEAFSYAQRAKGRTLLELLQNGRVNINKSASVAEREQEQQLNRKLVSLNRQISSEKLKPQPDEKRLADVKGQLKKARLEFEAFQTSLYAAHPEIKVQRGEIRPVSFEDVTDLIPNSKTALLDFIVTDESLHLFVLTKDTKNKPTLNTYTIKVERKSLVEKVERFRRRMENRDYDFQGLSHQLYDLLIKPAQTQLQNKTNLIISPDNLLWDLPFQALLSPGSRYLVEDAAISYVPSLSVLRELHLVREKNQSAVKASLLALGNPALGNRSVELAKFAKMGADLQPLPEAASQVRALGRLYGPSLSKVITGSAAREELVKEQSDRYRILHLATHGILNDVSPMYSNVMLSQTAGKSEEDGLLEAWEMMNLNLNADLVVLAACETARGRTGAGEGVIGMTWALFVAGCPRTVVSQWKVEASSTTALMLEFHKRFKTRYGGKQPAVSTAEAMRQAALKVMKNPEYAHPFYWGGFVVVGDGN